MAIQVRRGNEVDFDPSKMLPGEWAVSLDTRYVRMCFSPGICLRMATYEAFEADMAEIQSIVAEARTIQEAVARIQTEINDTAIVVEDYAILSKSYAVGGTGTREGEDVDNAKYYYEQAKYISQGGNGLVPLGSIAFENLPTEDIITNAMYNINNDFTSDNRFVDGGGILYGKGSNIFYTADGKWDVLAASDVKGVKGETEDTFRQGNVTITKSNLGMGDYGTADISNIADGTVKGGLSAVNENLGAIATDYVKRHGNFGYTYEMARGNHDFLTTNDYGNLPSIPEVSNYIYIIGKSAEGVVTGALAIGDDYSNRVYRYSAKDNAWDSLALNENLAKKMSIDGFVQADANTMTTAGSYSSGGWINTPSNYGALNVGGSGSYITHEFCDSVNHLFYYRDSIDGGATWTEWWNNREIYVENRPLSFTNGKCEIEGGNHFIISAVPIGVEITANIILVALPNTYRIILSDTTWNNELYFQITFTPM